jgi:hypothetical protein
MKETRCSAAFCFTGTTDSALFLSLYGRSKSQKAGGGGLRTRTFPRARSHVHATKQGTAKPHGRSN